MPSRRALLLMKHRLDTSPLPLTDHVRLELERELLDMLEDEADRRRLRVNVALVGEA